MNNKNVFIFEGLGSSFNIEKCWFNMDQMDILRQYVYRAESVLKISLWEYMLTPVEQRKTSLFKDWICVYISDYVIYKVLRSYAYKPSFILSYSVGLVFALASIGSISFEDGLRLVQFSYYFNGEKTTDKYAMAMIVGLEEDVIIDLLHKRGLDEYIDIGSVTNDTYILVSGLRWAIEEFCTEAEKIGALKCNIIQTPCAFHSKYAKIGIENLEKSLDSILISDAEVPIISCYGNKLIHTKEKIKNEIIMNVYEKIDWKDTLHQIADVPNVQFIEISMSGAILKMSKTLLKDAPSHGFKQLQKHHGYRQERSIAYQL